MRATLSKKLFVAAAAALPVMIAGAHDYREPLRGIWLAGDTHVHTDHSSDGSLPRQQTGQRAPGAAAWQNPVRVSANDTLADRHASIVADRNGDLVVAWDTRELRSSGVNVSLRSSRSVDGGQTWSAPIALGVEPTAMSQRPRLDLDRNGTVRAVWYDSRSLDWRWQVFTSQAISASEWSAPVQLSRAGNGTFPAVSQGVVVFTSDRLSPRVQRDIRHDIFVVRLDRRH